MIQDNKGKQPKQSFIVSPQEEILVKQTINEVFDNIGNALQIIEKKVQQFKPKEDSFPKLKTALQSLWNFFEAIKLININGNFASACDLLQSSAKGFDLVEEEELKDLAIGLNGYVTAAVQLQALNIGRGLELLTKAKDYLQNAGKYCGAFESLIDHMELDMFFVAGLQAALTLDYAKAKTLFDKASQVAEAVSNKYYMEGESLYYTFQGLAHFYRAYSTYTQVTHEFFQFDYDKVTNEQDLANDAKLARDLLAKGDTEPVPFKIIMYYSNALIQLLEVESELSKLMLTMFRSTFKSDVGTLDLLRKKVRKARNSISQIGPQAVTLIRNCDNFADQIDNLERLAKPSKKDFGVFSGLITCGLFLPIFLVVSWASTTFNLGLNAWALITDCLILALIGGFGFGAIRFKSFILQARPEKN